MLLLDKKSIHIGMSSLMNIKDISYARYRLVKAILDQTGANLLCVGDDWQSIYRFAGSDISLFTDFERYFGRSVIMALGSGHTAIPSSS